MFDADMLIFNSWGEYSCAHAMHFHGGVGGWVIWALLLEFEVKSNLTFGEVVISMWPADVLLTKASVQLQ